MTFHLAVVIYCCLLLSLLPSKCWKIEEIYNYGTVFIVFGNSWKCILTHIFEFKRRLLLLSPQYKLLRCWFVFIKNPHHESKQFIAVLVFNYSVTQFSILNCTSYIFLSSSKNIFLVDLSSLVPSSFASDVFYVWYVFLFMCNWPPGCALWTNYWALVFQPRSVATTSLVSVTYLYVPIV